MRVDASKVRMTGKLHRAACDNAPMNQEIETDDDTPLLHEENGELSLHFGFPTIQSRMLRSEPERLVLDYTRTMMGFLLFQPQPKRIAMIGLGGGSLAKYCHRYLPQCEFTAIELSPEVIALRATFGIPADSDTFRVICADGADYVRVIPDSLDVLLVDGFNRDGQPAQLCSAAFYDDCRAALRTGGVLVVNLCADDPGRDDYLARIQQAFDGRSLSMEADEGDNIIAFATRDGLFPPSLPTLTERLRAIEPQHAVELDKTAQKILGRGRSPRSPRSTRGKKDDNGKRAKRR